MLPPAQSHVGRREGLRFGLPCFLSPSPQVREALLECTDFAEPPVLAGFGEAFLSVGGHFLEPARLGEIDLEEAALDAGVFVDTRGGVGAVAGSEGDSSEEEVLFEVGPFLGGGRPQFPVGAGLAASFYEGVVGLDDVLGEDCGVAAGGFEVQVAEQARDDVQRQPGADEFGGEQAAEVVRGEGDRALALLESSLPMAFRSLLT